MRYTDLYNPNRTPQSQPATPAQVANSAGGYTFATSDRARLERFLILGSDRSSYYASAQELTRQNARGVIACLDADGPGTVNVIVEISRSGRAPKPSPAIFALALAAFHSDDATRAAALEALPLVCRTASHLFEFIATVKELRGWGRGLRKAVCRWYVSKSPDALAYQVVKYRQRGGFTHRDVLRLAGGAIRQVGALTPQHEALLRWVAAGPSELGERDVKRGDLTTRYDAISKGDLPQLVRAFERAQTLKDPRAMAALIREHRLTHEMVPSDYLRFDVVWEALAADMPMTALLRNLGRLTSLGVIGPKSGLTQRLTKQLRDAGRLRKARLHPLSILVALNTYTRGRGVRGSLQWKPLGVVKDALEDAYDLSFGTIPATGARTLLALDVSGSMGFSEIAGMTGITPRVGAAAMVMATMRVERDWLVKGFSTSLVDIPIHARMSLSKVQTTVGKIPMGGTDCAQPMLWATRQKVPVDAFVIYTDNETWFGKVHPFQALRAYRQKMGIPAKLIVVGMVSNGFTIADPTDPGMLDVVGFDTAAPRVMADFIST